MDLNDNNIIDSEDEPGPIPIIVEVTVNSGHAVFISDAGLATDNLWTLTSIDDKPEYKDKEYMNNQFLVDIIIQRYQPGGTIIFDISKQSASSSYFHSYPSE